MPALSSCFPQITQTEVQQGQQQFSQFTDGQVGTQPGLGSKDADGMCVWVGRAVVSPLTVNKTLLIQVVVL